MTDPADLAHEVLVKVALFVRSLPADQLADLASGAAKLELVPKGGRAARAGITAALPRPAEDIAATIREIGDRAAARRYLAVDLKLGVAQLRTLAADLGITVRRLKKDIVDDIVEWTVGRRLDSEAISRAGGAYR